MVHNHCDQPGIKPLTVGLESGQQIFIVWVVFFRQINQQFLDDLDFFIWQIKKVTDRFVALENFLNRLGGIFSVDRFIGIADQKVGYLDIAVVSFTRSRNHNDLTSWVSRDDVQCLFNGSPRSQ